VFFKAQTLLSNDGEAHQEGMVPRLNDACLNNPFSPLRPRTIPVSSIHSTLTKSTQGQLALWEEDSVKSGCGRPFCGIHTRAKERGGVKPMPNGWPGGCTRTLSEGMGRRTMTRQLFLGVGEGLSHETWYKGSLRVLLLL